MRARKNLDKQLKQLHRDGVGREESAAILGVTKRTVIRWAKRLGITQGQQRRAR